MDRRHITLERKSAIDRLTRLPMPPGVASLRSYGQCENDPEYFFFEYRPEEGERRAAAPKDLTERAELALAILAAAQAWAGALPDPLLVLPGDLLLDAGGRPKLLWFPVWFLPEFHTLLEFPERLLHCTPRLFAQDGLESFELGASVTCYSLGMIVFSLFNRLSPPGPGADELAAAWRLPESVFSESELPFWLVNRGIGGVVNGIIRELMLNCHKGAPEALASARAKLADITERMEPLEYLKEMRAEGKSFEALKCVRDMQLTDSSGELMLAAAVIALDDVFRPVDALAYLDRAAAMDPGRREAFGRRFRLVAGAGDIVAIRELFGDTAKAVELDTQLERDYERATAGDVSEEERDALLEAYARFQLWRGRAGKAARAVYGGITDGKGQSLWWKFGLNLLYLEILIAMGSYADAHRAAGSIRAALENAEKNPHFIKNEIIGTKKRLAHLEVQLDLAEQKTKKP